MSIVLGLNSFHAGSSAAIVVDGEPVAAIAEERLNRVKYYAGFPKLAIAECLRLSGLDFEDIDHVAVGRDSSANLKQKLSYVVRNPSLLMNLAKLKQSRNSLDDLKQLIADECGVSDDRLRFQQHNIEHHLAHIASAYFASGWDEAAGFSADGSGDFVTCMMARCSGSEIEPIHRVFVPHSLGSLYTMVCEFIGYDRYGDEGKVMGLAPLGTDRYHDIFEEILILEEDGIKLNPEYFMPFGSNQGLHINDNGQVELQRHYTDKMVELFGPARKRYAEITERDQDLAHALQHVFERGYMHLLNILHDKVPLDRVAMAGGCTLNSVANGKLFDETPFKETWIQPAAGDDGLALGAALYVSRTQTSVRRSVNMIDAYLGPQYSDDAIESELREAGLVSRKLSRTELIEATCEDIADGKVVGWFQGRMEWGPRALGNRSILAHPGLDNMKDVLNARIKHREEFRPFAPSVLAERQDEIFEKQHPSPFMLHVYKIRPEWRDRLPAVNHVDDTGRLQTVSREENELYYDLISRFAEKTGIPIVLNTSFNENEPIVCRPKEAIDCFSRTKMDTIVIASFVCRKSEQPGGAGGEASEVVSVSADRLS